MIIEKAAVKKKHILWLSSICLLVLLLVLAYIKPSTASYTNHHQDSPSLHTHQHHQQLQSQTKSSKQEFTQTLINNSQAIDSSSHMTNDDLPTLIESIRPDIYHILKASFTDKKDLLAALKGAAILQNYLDNPDQNIKTVLKEYDCTVIALNPEEQTLIKYLTFDTPKKQNTLKEALSHQPPQVSVDIKLDEKGNPIHPCDLPTQ